MDYKFYLVLIFIGLASTAKIPHRDKLSPAQLSSTTIISHTSGIDSIILIATNLNLFGYSIL